MDLGRFGRRFVARALRRRRRWRQVDLAARSGVSAAQVGRIERGESRHVTLDVLDRVAAGVGGSVDVLLRWKGEGLDRLLDQDHARLVELVVTRLHALGWIVAVEVSFSRFGERGSIDVLAFHPGRRAVAVFEVKSVTPDLQAMLVGLDRKARLGPAIARERGWSPLVTARILVLADTRTNRRRVETHAATIRAALLARTRDVVRWLGDPRAPAVSGVWFLADRRSTDLSTGGRERIALRHERSAGDPYPGSDSQPPGGASSLGR